MNDQHKAVMDAMGALNAAVMALLSDKPSVPSAPTERLPNSGRTSERGLNALVREEGKRLKVYKDAAGYDTVGIGHMVMDRDKPFIRSDGTISEDLMMKWLREDIVTAEEPLRDIVLPYQCQFDACVSLVFNVGVGAFARSTLRAKLHKATDNLDRNAAARGEFPRWKYADGKPILLARRLREVEMFIHNIYTGRLHQ